MVFLLEVFTAWLGTDWDLVVSIEVAYRVGNLKRSQRFLRDTVLKFPQWSIKTKVVQSFGEQLGVMRAGSEISIYPDLSDITLKK